MQRLEDEQLLKGAGVYANDVSPAGQTRLCFVRSSYAHARIVSIDTSAAQSMPGVRLVVTGAQLVAEGIKPMPKPVNFTRADGSPAAAPTRNILAVDRVRYVGEPIVAVVADKHVIVDAPLREAMHFPHPFVQDFFLGERGQRAMEVLQPRTQGV